MNKWELAYYLIDAKKSIDILLYIQQNHSKLTHIDLVERVKKTLDNFYLKCAIVLEKSHPSQKKSLCNRYEEIESIYKERDKNVAHKDDDYQPTNKNFNEKIDYLKECIVVVKDVCQNCLPDKLTLNYVPFDGELFRIVHGITVDMQKHIDSCKYNNQQNQIDTNIKYGEKILVSDVDDIKQINVEDASKYGILIKNGINCEEGLQNRQDACIKINLLFGKNMWVVFNEEDWQKQQYYRSLGFFDQFDILQIPVTEKEQEDFIQKAIDLGLIEIIKTDDA